MFFNHTQDHLADIEVVLSISSIVTDELLVLPSWLPSLNDLYSLMVIIMLRYPTSLAQHVMSKYKQFATRPTDHSAFIAEMRPVLEEIAMTVACAEALTLSKDSASSGQFSIVETIADSRVHFCEVLKTGYEINSLEHNNIMSITFMFSYRFAFKIYLEQR